MNLSERLDAAILAWLILWALMDRFNIYFDRRSDEEKKSK